MTSHSRRIGPQWLSLVLALLGVAFVAFSLTRGAEPVEAQIQGTIKGYAQTLSGSVTLNNGTGVQLIPNPNAVSLPAGGSSSESFNWTDSGSLTVRISGSASTSCTGMSSAPLVIDATCTSEITNLAVSFQSVTPIQIGRIVAKSSTVATGSTIQASSGGTLVEGVCVREAQGFGCVPIAPGGSANFTFPPMSGSVTLQTETPRTSDGNVQGKGVRVTAVRINMTLIPTSTSPTGGSLSLSLGLADSFVGGVATPTPLPTNTGTPTPLHTPAPTSTPTPTDPHPFKAFVPVLSRDD